MEYEAVIGLEVHVQLLTETKIFCNCSTKFGAPPNTNVCPVCLGMPGVLPVLNKKVVDFAIRLAIATHCRINKRSVFARKNYFYPDLPKGYQISQYELPIAEDGYVEFDLDGERRRVGLIRIHMEEDAGKLVHGEGADRHSYVDFNRSGVPLLEIVSKPDIKSPKEATAYARALRQIVRYMGISDGNMEEGSMRADANISIRPKGTTGLGVKAEIKNMNSFHGIERALQYEIERQTLLLESGGKVVQETRLWDAASGKTYSMRSKEEAHDYRYFPEPDLVFLDIDGEWIEKEKSNLPELPLERADRFIRDYELPPYDASVLTAERGIADYFEEVVKLFPEPKTVSNWIMSEFLHHINEDKIDIYQSKVTPKMFAEMLHLIKKGTISGKIGKSVFQEMYERGESPEKIIEEKGLVQITDESFIEEVIDKVISANPDVVEKYKSGKKGVIGFFVGQVMKETRGKANPEVVNRILREKLGG